MNSSTKTKHIPKLVKLDRALKLAETWVSSMSGSAPAGPDELDFDGRPSRLGLGARIGPSAKAAASTDPVERKLIGKLNAHRKKKSSENLENTRIPDKTEPDNDDDDEPESRTSAFSKKRTLPLATSVQLNKKSK